MTRYYFSDEVERRGRDVALPGACTLAEAITATRTMRDEETYWSALKALTAEGGQRWLDLAARRQTQQRGRKKERARA